MSLVLDAGALLAIERRDRRVGALLRLGALLAVTGGSDVVDAHVASLARPGDQVLTSDPDDLGRLLDAISVRATVILV